MIRQGEDARFRVTNDLTQDLRDRLPGAAELLEGLNPQQEEAVKHAGSALLIVAGAGSAFYMSGAMIYLIDIAPPEKRTRYVATNQWALSVGVALGPGVGGVIADARGLSAPFTVVAVLASDWAFSLR